MCRHTVSIEITLGYSINSLQLFAIEAETRRLIEHYLNTGELRPIQIFSVFTFNNEPTLSLKNLIAISAGELYRHKNMVENRTDSLSRLFRSMCMLLSH